MIDLDKLRLEELEKELSLLTEPTIEELIEEGKLSSPYFNILEQIKSIKDANNI